MLGSGKYSRLAFVMLRLVLFVAALAAAVVARKSVNSDYVESFLKSPEGQGYSADLIEDALLDVPGLIAKYGYPVEVHNVVTSDGYILEMHRIPHGRNNVSNGVPVFVMHGLLSSSADFLTTGPDAALGYMLADAGYDVWFGNARGNYYSRYHTHLNPDSILNKDFWRFSWDEIGNIDLPTFIDHILETTGKDKIHYIGHSQGGTSFLVMASLRPEYNDKIIAFQGLAPASFFENNEVELFRSLARYENVLETTAFATGFHEIMRDSVHATRQCAEDSMLSGVCDLIINEVFGREYYNKTLIPVILGHVPAGASIRQVAHYGQVMRFNAFRRYNHNIITNLQKYGTRVPPDYDLSLVTTPVYLYYGLADAEVNFKDVHKLARSVRYVRKLFRAARSTFHHVDFLFAMDAKELIYKPLLEALRHAENRLLFKQ